MAIDIKQINTAANISKVSTNKTDPKTDQTGNSPESASASSKSDSVSITTQAQQLQKFKRNWALYQRLIKKKWLKLSLLLQKDVIRLMLKS